MNIRNHTKTGAALFTILAIVFTTSAILGVTVAAGMQRAFMARKLSDRIHAKVIAEAGANEAYARLVTNFEARKSDEFFPPTTYAGGQYDVGIRLVSDRVAIIHSTGVYNSAVCDVILDIMDFGPPGYPGSPGSSAFDYAIVCGGNMDFQGCGTLSSTSGLARVHANGELVVQGDAQANVSIESSTKVTVKNVTIDGNVSAPDLSVHSAAVVTGTTTQEAVPLVTIPDIDLTPYYNWAKAHGEVRSGFSMSGGSYTPSGGILWVDGDVQLSSSYNFNGSIIATGKIHLSGSGNVTATTCAFAVATRDGPEIRNQTTGTVKGLIYAKSGDYVHTANGSVEGQIIIRGDINKGGNSDVLLYGDCEPTPPGAGEPPSAVIAVTAWQK